MSVHIKLRPSHICAAILVFGYSLTLLIIFILPIVTLAKFACAFLLVFAMVYYLRRDAWLSLSSSPVALRIGRNDIALITRGGRELVGQISGDSFVTPMLTILNVMLSGQKNTRCVVIFPDSLDKESFREMRVLLKWGREN